MLRVYLTFLLCVSLSQCFIHHKTSVIKRARRDISGCEAGVIVLVDNNKDTWDNSKTWLKGLLDCLPEAAIEYTQCSASNEGLSVLSPVVYNNNTGAFIDALARDEEAPGCLELQLFYASQEERDNDYEFIVSIFAEDTSSDLRPLHITVYRGSLDAESEDFETTISDLANKLCPAVRHRRSISKLNVALAFDEDLVSGDVLETVTSEVAKLCAESVNDDILVSVVSYNRAINAVTEADEFTYTPWVWKAACSNVLLSKGVEVVVPDRLCDYIFEDHLSQPEPDEANAAERNARHLLIVVGEQNPGINAIYQLFYIYAGDGFPNNYNPYITSAAKSPYINFICPRLSGRFAPPNVKCPNYFIACSNGKPVRVDCNGNTRYSSYFGNCVPPYLSLGCESFKEIFFEGNENCIVNSGFVHGFFSIDGLCDRYRICTGGLALEVQCAEGEVYDAYGSMRCLNKLEVNGPCGEKGDDPFGESCAGREDGYYRVENDCSLYTKCADGVKHIYTCDFERAFDSVNKVCVPASDIPGCGAPPEEVSADFCVQVNGGHDGIYAHPNNCAKVVACFNNFPLIFNCRAGALFNPQKRFCTLDPELQPTNC